ncbi:hypothetical protein J6590_090079 [Homalodisca vitripennis]|nr:hypothetical protein J6590_090079 [Homalodisca vitripennis]
MGFTPFKPSWVLDLYENISLSTVAREGAITPNLAYAEYPVHTRVKIRRAWVTAERSCPCKQPACPDVGGGSEVTLN